MYHTAGSSANAGLEANAVTIYIYGPFQNVLSPNMENSNWSNLEAKLLCRYIELARTLTIIKINEIIRKSLL